MISLLFPYLSFQRLNQRYQEEPMSCPTPCSKCSCEDRETVYCNDYVEIDPSPLATQAKKFLAEEAKRAASPASFYERFCNENPSAQECKIYED